MDAALRMLNVALPVLYGVTALAYGVDFRRGQPPACGCARPLLVATLVLHVSFLAVRTADLGHAPLASLPEILSAVALSIAVVFRWVAARFRGAELTGVFLVAVACGLQTLSTAFLPAPGPFPPLLESPLFGIHAGFAVLGYTAFTVSAVYGLLFLVLYHELKVSRFGMVFRRLPALDLLARMSLRAALFGVASLAVTIAVGAVWAAHEFPRFWTDPKFATTVVVWGVYAVAVTLHYALGWRARRTIHLALSGFALLVAAAAAGVWLPSFHLFR
jgi:ABC-type uncharacterized transport system permease subunit